MKSRSIVASLPEVHSTVNTARHTLLRRMLAFAGPAYLVSVGYMDPGNWATDLEGGATLRLYADLGFGDVQLHGHPPANPQRAPGHRIRPRPGASLPRDVSAARHHLALGAVRDRHRRLRSGGGAGRGHRPEHVIRIPLLAASSSPPPTPSWYFGCRASASA